MYHIVIYDIVKLCCIYIYYLCLSLLDLFLVCLFVFRGFPFSPVQAGRDRGGVCGCASSARRWQGFRSEADAFCNDQSPVGLLWVESWHRGGLPSTRTEIAGTAESPRSADILHQTGSGPQTVNLFAAVLFQVSQINELELGTPKLGSLSYSTAKPINSVKLPQFDFPSTQPQPQIERAVEGPVHLSMVRSAFIF